MTIDLVILWLIVAMVPPLTVFPFALAWFARGVWYRTTSGRATMVATTGLALLVDEYMLYRALGDYDGRDIVRLVVVALICLGAYLKAGSLFYESLIRSGSVRDALRRAIRRLTQ